MRPMLATYRALLLLLPRAFHREYGAEMEAVVEEHWAEAGAGLGPAGALGFWLRQGWAVIRIAVTLRIRGGGPAEVASLVDHVTRRGGRRGEMMDGLWQDVRHSTRALARRPGFALVTVVTLGLGIGACTAIFSAVHAVLLRDLPYEEPERIVVVFHEGRETGERGNGVSAANARDLWEEAERLSVVAVAEPWSLDLEVDGRAESLRAWAVSEGFFEAVGVEAALGRTFRPEDHVPGSEPVVLLGHRSWRTRFAGDPAVVGRVLTVEGQAIPVVGILPEGFRLPDEAEVWVPRRPREEDGEQRAADFMTGFGRLAPGATLDAAEDEARRVAASLAEQHPETNGRLSFRLVPLREHLFGNVRTPLLVLLGAVGFVLLIACVNVAGLMLARAAERRREYALRSALGAGAGRLARRIAVESLLLAGGGCLIGLGLAWLGVRTIRGLGPDHLPRIDQIGIDGTVLAFSVAAAVLSALIAALVPSLRLARLDPGASLADGSRTSSPGRGRTSARHRLVVLEVAAAMVLVVGAGLLFRSFSTLLDRDLGFEPENRLALQLFAYGYESAQERANFVNATLDEMEAIPGVRRVALTSTVPAANDAGALSSIDIELPFTVQDRTVPPRGQEPRARMTQASPNYFGVMGIPRVEGRDFETSDGPEAPPVIIVNEALARRHFGDRSPIGEQLVIGFRPLPREIVGVVADVRPGGFESEPVPEVYFPLTQVGTGSLTFILEAEGDAASLTGPAMEAVWRVNPSQSIWGAATVEGLLSEWLVERRFNLLLLGAFAAVALLLAVVGIYGLISFSVAQRSAELGIRRALGSRSSSILRLVLGEGARLALMGVGIGLIGSLALTRFLQGMLFEVEPHDPAVLVFLGLAVLGASMLATLVPAMRALGSDPAAVLRTE